MAGKRKTSPQSAVLNAIDTSNRMLADKITSVMIALNSIKARQEEAHRIFAQDLGSLLKRHTMLFNNQVTMATELAQIKIIAGAKPAKEAAYAGEHTVQKETRAHVQPEITATNEDLTRSLVAAWERIDRLEAWLQQRVVNLETEVSVLRRWRNHVVGNAR